MTRFCYYIHDDTGKLYLHKIINSHSKLDSSYSKEYYVFHNLKRNQCYCFSRSKTGAISIPNDKLYEVNLLQGIGCVMPKKGIVGIEDLDGKIKEEITVSGVSSLNLKTQEKIEPPKHMVSSNTIEGSAVDERFYIHTLDSDGEKLYYVEENAEPPVNGFSIFYPAQRGTYIWFSKDMNHAQVFFSMRNVQQTKQYLMDQLPSPTSEIFISLFPEGFFVENPKKISPYVTPVQYDHINPQHYKNYSMEVIDMFERIYGTETTAAYCEMNALKYRMRMGMKPDQPVERDMDKEKWYLNKATELREKGKEEKIDLSALTFHPPTTPPAH